MKEKGTMMVAGFELKYEITTTAENSDLGIEGGRITELIVEYSGWDLAHFAKRGWITISRDPITLTAVGNLLKLYN